MDNKQKRTAAVAAVMAYIRSEEDAVMAAGLSPVEPVPETPAPQVQYKPWGVSGRLDQMNLRTMMQMKAFHR